MRLWESSGGGKSSQCSVVSSEEACHLVQSSEREGSRGRDDSGLGRRLGTRPLFPCYHSLGAVLDAEMASSSSSCTTVGPELLSKQHIMFAFRSLKFLPTPYQAEDNNRCEHILYPFIHGARAHPLPSYSMSLAYFCLSALALLPSSAVSTINPSLAAVDVMLKPEQKQGFKDWVYRLQASAGGFPGSDSLAGTERDEQ